MVIRGQCVFQYLLPCCGQEWRDRCYQLKSEQNVLDLWINHYCEQLESLFVNLSPSVFLSNKFLKAEIPNIWGINILNSVFVLSVCNKRHPFCLVDREQCYQRVWRPLLYLKIGVSICHLSGTFSVISSLSFQLSPPYLITGVILFTRHPAVFRTVFPGYVFTSASHPDRFGFWVVGSRCDMAGRDGYILSLDPCGQSNRNTSWNVLVCRMKTQRPILNWPVKMPKWFKRYLDL